MAAPIPGSASDTGDNLAMTAIFFQQHRPPGTPTSGGRAFAGLAYPQDDPAPQWFQQASDERIDYSVIFEIPAGDTITGFAATSNDSRFLVNDASVSGATVMFWVGPGGVPKTFYEVTVSASTAGGRTFNKLVRFFVTEGVVPSVAAALGGGGRFGTPPRPYGCDPIDTWATG